ncbi:MAG: hypothetical protein M3R08_05040 [Bacteroidota bacterium]|nr:hypothetical protein [Bacteroidota bacterium]
MHLETSIETRLTILEWSDKGILFIRFKLGMSINLKGIQEIVEQRVALSAGERVAVLSVLPPDLDADIDVMVSDHGMDVKHLTIAEATVACTSAHRKLAELYYSHFPQPFPTGVFGSEQEATQWLIQQRQMVSM